MRIVLVSVLFLSVFILAVILFFIFYSGSAKPLRHLNETCKHKNYTGICKSKDLCLTNLKDVNLELCREGDLSLICCPSEEIERPMTLLNLPKAVGNTTTNRPKRTPGETADNMCKIYGATAIQRRPNPSNIGPPFQEVLDCPPQKLIKGGENATEREFPHMAQIGNFKLTGNNEIIWECGGSVVSPEFILSAAHCKVSEIYGFAMVGTNKVEGTAEFFKKHVFSIIKVIKHPNYDAQYNSNDIALYKLSEKLKDTIRPICLDTGRSIVSNMTVIATGFGINKAQHETDVLQKVQMNIVDQSSCTTKYSKIGRIIPEYIVCAYAEGKDTCSGDSGGPIQITHSALKCMYTLVGVTSFGVNCTLDTNLPGVYMRVSSYIGWIEDVIWPAQG